MNFWIHFERIADEMEWLYNGATPSEEFNELAIINLALHILKSNGFSVMNLDSHGNLIEPNYARMVQKHFMRN